MFTNVKKKYCREVVLAGMFSLALLHIFTFFDGSVVSMARSMILLGVGRPRMEAKVNAVTVHVASRTPRRRCFVSSMSAFGVSISEVVLISV